VASPFEQREHFLDNFVHVDQLTLRRRFLVERTYTVDDLSRTIPNTYRFSLLPHGPDQDWAVRA
jgi:hypothetical protein